MPFTHRVVTQPKTGSDLSENLPRLGSKPRSFKTVKIAPRDHSKLPPRDHSKLPQSTSDPRIADFFECLFQGESQSTSRSGRPFRRADRLHKQGETMVFFLFSVPEGPGGLNQVKIKFLPGLKMHCPLVTDLILIDTVMTCDE